MKGKGKTPKRALSVLMAISLIFTYSGMTAFGAEAENDSWKNQVSDYGGVIYYDAAGNAGGAVNENNFVVSTKKTIEQSQTNENEFDITLKVETTVDTSKIEIYPDAAVVLVIDLSGSMNEIVSGTKTRLQAAKEAAKNFLDSFVAEAGDASRMVSIVSFNGFGSGAINDPFIGYSKVEMGWTDVAANGVGATKALIDGFTADRGTFTQGGLMLARNLYLPANAPKVNGKVIENRFVIMLTDGNPTHMLRTGTGTTPNVSSTSITSITANHLTGSESIANVSPGSYAAQTVANQIKNGGFNSNYTAKLYTVGFGISNTAFRRDGATTGTTGAVTGNQWLANIADKHYTAANVSELNVAFEKISETITRMANAWKVTDPMAEYIEFRGFITPQDGTFAESDGTVIWDIKNATPVSESQRDAATKVYTYEIKYKISLDNMEGYKAGDVIATNDRTTLTYVVDSKKADEYNEAEFITADFTIPGIFGFADGLEFKKVDQNGGALEGAKFELYYNGSLFADATSGDGGKVSFADIPSGHEYTLKEVSAPTVGGVKYIADNTQYYLNVSYGTLAGEWTGSFSGSGSNLTFRNSPESFKVTVQYWVKGAESDTYRQVRQMTAVQDGYLNGEAYEWSIDGADVYDSISAYGRSYYFALGENEFTEDGFITGIEDKTNLEGVIDNSDVVIDLYYTRIALPDVPFTKAIDKLSDATYPDDYAFTFALYTGDGKVKVTKDLTIGKADVGETQYFEWELPRGIKPADLRGTNLFIKEESAFGWDSDAMDKYVLYGTLDRLVGFTPAQGFMNGNITNIFEQEPYDADIELRKFFEGNGVELLPEFDGAVLYPYHEETEAVDAVYDYQEIRPAVISHDGEGHDDTCYDESGELICGEEDIDAVYGDVEISPAAPAHKHDNSCYAYEFTFDLTAMIGGAVKYTDSDTVTIPYDDMLALLNGSERYEKISFTIPKGSLPAPGSGEVLSVTITESDNNYGWVANADVSGVTVDAYGNVTYPNRLGYSEMTNTFGGIKVPGFGFSKTVIDARSIFGGIASYYTGDFTFELTASDGFNDTVTLKAVKGIGAASLEFPRYIGAEYVELTLKEVTPANKVAGMTYDAREFRIVIENGKVTQVNPVGRLDKTPIVFVNTLLTPIDPVATVNKWVNTETEKAEFTFSWSYEGFENANLLSPRPVSGSGADSIAVNDGGDQFFEIELPRNFTGKLTITEAADKFMENWAYDNNKTRTIDYILGKPAGRNATGEATFYNNYYVPEIELAKTVNANNVVLYDEIAYTITVVNTGAEDLKNVVIKDAMFNETVKVLKPVAGPNALGSILSEGEGYILDLDEGTITLLADLKQGEKVFVRYTVIPYETGEIYNVATVEAERTVTMGEGVTDSDDETVIVDKYISQLLVKKSVAAYRDGLDLEDESIIWNDNGISFTSAGNKAVFKVVITNTGDGVLYVNDVKDVFGDTDLARSTFYYGGEAYSGLTALLEEISTVPLYRGDGEIVFYFITGELDARGTFTNNVTVEATDSYQETHRGSDDADVTTSWGRGGNPPVNPPTGDGDANPNIGEPEVPLAIMPEDDMIIPEEDVPLLNIPQTGVGTMEFSFAMLGMSLAALLGAAFVGMRKRKEKSWTDM